MIDDDDDDNGSADILFDHTVPVSLWETMDAKTPAVRWGKEIGPFMRAVSKQHCVHHFEVSRESTGQSSENETVCV